VTSLNEEIAWLSCLRLVRSLTPPSSAEEKKCCISVVVNTLLLILTLVSGHWPRQTCGHCHFVLLLKVTGTPLCYSCCSSSVSHTNLQSISRIILLFWYWYRDSGYKRSGYASHSGGSGFKYRLGDPLSWLTLFVVFLSSSRQIPREYLQLGQDRFLPQPFQFIIHLQLDSTLFRMSYWNCR